MGLKNGVMPKGLIESGQSKSVLVITVDVLSKLVNPNDKSVVPIFGDAAAASLILETEGDSHIGGFTYGTDGSGAGNLIVPSGGLRSGEDFAPASAVSSRGLKPSGYDLFMDGPAIFNFTLDVVPKTVDQVLRKTGLVLDDIDLFVFHQANKFMLDHLRQKLGIPEENFFIDLEETGNTSSASIPIALSRAAASGALKKNDTVMVLGFGVGYSWAGAVLTW